MVRYVPSETDARRDIREKTGLSVKGLEHIIRMLEEQGFDWKESIDWKTVGEDTGDMPNKYDSVWNKLKTMYGISKPLTSSDTTNLEEKYDDIEASELMRTKEGVRELLRRAYGDSNIPSKKKEFYKNYLLEEAPAGIATAIALYDGNERPFAMCFLKEKVLDDDVTKNICPIKIKKADDIYQEAQRYGSAEDFQKIAIDALQKSKMKNRLTKKEKAIYDALKYDSSSPEGKQKYEEFQRLYKGKSREEIFNDIWKKANAPLLEPTTAEPVESNKEVQKSEQDEATGVFKLPRPVLSTKEIELEPPPRGSFLHAEELTLKYGYDDLRKIGYAHRTSVSGTKLEIIKKFLEEGWL